jgi:hypothetical protein
MQPNSLDSQRCGGERGGRERESRGKKEHGRGGKKEMGREGGESDM